MPVLSGAVCAEPRPPAPSQARRWPRRWADRQLLLERQHDGLEALLAELLHGHDPAEPAWSAAEAIAWERACRRLIWDLGLHLRLEERWLAAQGCLCPGHRGVHARALEEARAGLLRSSGDRQARLSWLLELQRWFVNHREGPDAMAYAAASATPSTSVTAR